MTAHDKTHAVIRSLASRGIDIPFEDANTLRRAQLTLRRWAELECGDGNNYASWAIERDKETDKPYLVTYPHNGKSYRRKVADRERGALKRLGKIIGDRNTRAWVASGNPSVAETAVTYYQQTDPRGCTLYILRPGDIPADRDVSSYYTRGLAIAA